MEGICASHSSLPFSGILSGGGGQKGAKRLDYVSVPKMAGIPFIKNLAYCLEGLTRVRGRVGDRNRGQRAVKGHQE